MCVVVRVAVILGSIDYDYMVFVSSIRARLILEREKKQTQIDAQAVSRKALEVTLM